jgi:hypothetical protein
LPTLVSINLFHAVFGSFRHFFVPEFAREVNVEVVVGLVEIAALGDLWRPLVSSGLSAHDIRGRPYESAMAQLADEIKDGTNVARGAGDWDKGLSPVVIHQLFSALFSGGNGLGMVASFASFFDRPSLTNEFGYNDLEFFP